jgi:hypothetical protein
MMRRGTHATAGSMGRMDIAKGLTDRLVLTLRVVSVGELAGRVFAVVDLEVVASSVLSSPPAPPALVDELSYIIDSHLGN